ncbi:MAG: SH3 domain-containing protein [Anaerolineae bacterium]|nr:SH3 domain-containing protein [Anaerolineae bacterium]
MPAASQTPSPTPSPTATAPDTPTLTATVTPSPSETAPPTDTPTATLTPSATPDLDATADALLALRLSQTAESWTDTPTPDLEATAEALLALRLTQTAASWTDTPTATSTFTPSPSATLTHTPSPTLTVPPSPTPRPTLSPTPTGPALCNQMPFRMKEGEGGRTTLYPRLDTNVRSAPGTSSPSLRKIPPGQTFEVIAGPECAGSIAWWEIKVYDRSGLWTGWIGEGQNGTYWIEPFEAGPASCPGALPPRMVPGDTGRITYTPPDPSRVRSAPRVVSGNVIGMIQPGGQFTVVSGPVCDTTRQLRWWLVRTERLEGWVAEGQSSQYWMEPWP